MRRAAPFAALLMLMLAGCGSGPTPPPRDDALDQAFASGQQAMAGHQPDRAVTYFEEARRHAVQRDDGRELAAAGYDLATAQLAAGTPDAALATVSQTRDQLLPHGLRDVPELDLVEAAALERLGRNDAAAAAASRAQGASDPAIAARATFLAGLVADHRGDVAALRAARDRLTQPASAAQAARTPRWRRADRAELDARLALAQNLDADARSSALTAAGLRQAGLDYPGMRRALDLAARASDAAGDPNAAAAYRQRAAASAAAVQPSGRPSEAP